MKSKFRQTKRNDQPIPVACNQKGFSLVEVLIAAIIVSVGLLGSAKFQAEMLQQGVTTKSRTSALHAANSLIEHNRHFANSTEYGAFTTDSDVLSATAGSVSDLNRSWNVIDDVNLNYKQVMVNVYWSEASGTKYISLTSYIAEDNPVLSGRSLYLEGQQSQQSVNQTNYDVIISGNVTAYNGNKAWNVSITNGSCTTTASSYTCTVLGNQANASTNARVDFTTDGIICGAASATFNLSANNPYATQNFYHAVTANQCA